ncbi:hypothetical protein DFH09DRAFT_1103016 [Mycena vulgaris]|nr:hypothetical protein DFH09DRAFT_1103016 [Mycena vulgaris]
MAPWITPDPAFAIRDECPIDESACEWKASTPAEALLWVNRGYHLESLRFRLPRTFPSSRGLAYRRCKYHPDNAGLALGPLSWIWTRGGYELTTRSQRLWFIQAWTYSCNMHCRNSLFPYDLPVEAILERSTICKSKMMTWIFPRSWAAQSQHVLDSQISERRDQGSDYRLTWRFSVGGILMPHIPVCRLRSFAQRRRGSSVYPFESGVARRDSTNLSETI